MGRRQPDRRLQASAVALLLGLAAESALAQRLTGTVTDSASGAPIAGAVVALNDGAGALIARGMTNQAGAFSVASHPSLRRVSVRRLGYRPRDVDVAAGTAQLDIRVMQLPTLLQPVSVAAASNCPRRNDREPAYALLEQARAGLLASVVARKESPAESMVLLRYERKMQETSDRIERQNVTIDSSGRMAGSFGALKSAREFIRDGFVEQIGPDLRFLGPDADVLLDDAFGEGYCFHLRRGEASRPNQAGLAFVAANRRRERVDVDGTLWVDTLAREIREIEFRYVGLPPDADKAKPGGRVTFWTMKNGVVFVERWNIRVPGVGADTTYPSTGNMLPQIRTWIEAEERGGEVASARWEDGLAFQGSLGTFFGRVVDKKGNPEPNVIVRLRDSDYIASSADDGRFGINLLLPGPYYLDVIDPRWVKLGISFPSKLRFTAQRDSVTEGELRDPHMLAYVIQGCTGEKWSNAAPLDLTMLVTDAIGRPMRHTEWEISRSTGSDWQRIRERRVTDAEGKIYSCLRMDEGTVVDLKLFEGGRQIGSARPRVPKGGALVTVKVSIQRP